jgi:hypothetical protein
VTGIYTRSGGQNGSHWGHTCRWRKTGRVYLPEIHHYRYFHECAEPGCPCRRTALVQIPEPKRTDEIVIGNTIVTRKWMCIPPSLLTGLTQWEITSSDWGTDRRTGARTQLIYAWKALP